MRNREERRATISECGYLRRTGRESEGMKDRGIFVEVEPNFVNLARKLSPRAGSSPCRLPSAKGAGRRGGRGLGRGGGGHTRSTSVLFGSVRPCALERGPA
ncbi:uncharacterized protein LOC105434362 [Pogonomyrmex barbatus]|uniref:Uncharacterized protein LOC105434362 n=1 Tax=Pogonomyrmex barbatus TaxID=144034 RepID=A0A6I9WXU0_9HYME|nr:uncharacterized protein LOC105434362 [Pogonomyrmex barbatus]